MTEAERATWDEYTNVRALSDWPGFDKAMGERKEASRKWLQARRNELVALVKKEPKAKATADRRKRIAQLAPKNLNGGKPKHEVRLPCTGDATHAEKAYIEEREVYMAITSEYDAQRARKVQNSDWLVRRRKDLFRLREAEPNSEKDASRRRRYEDLCIATRFGEPYKRWEKTHNKWGVAYAPEPEGGRGVAVKNARKYLGVTEKPAGSNRGTPQPSGWQRRVYGSDGVPWCACWTTCMAWDSGVKGSGSAAVAICCSLAAKGQGIYRGWTTDPKRVRAGDHVVISSCTTHIEMVVDDDDAYHTIGGNTSPGAGGSQANGGGVWERNRRGQVNRWLLVRY